MSAQTLQKATNLTTSQNAISKYEVTIYGAPGDKSRVIGIVHQLKNLGRRVQSQAVTASTPEYVSEARGYRFEVVSNDGAAVRHSLQSNLESIGLKYDMKEIKPQVSKYAHAAYEFQRGLIGQSHF